MRFGTCKQPQFRMAKKKKKEEEEEEEEEEKTSLFGHHSVWFNRLISRAMGDHITCRAWLSRACHTVSKAQ